MLMINQYNYFCPKCDRMLNEDNKIIFTVEGASNEKIKMFLDPKPGYYNFKCEPETAFKLNEQVNFHCPYCEENLKSNKYPKFIEILLRVTDKVSFDVFFSRVYGNHTTYVGIEDFEEEYGQQIASV